MKKINNTFAKAKQNHKPMKNNLQNAMEGMYGNNIQYYYNGILFPSDKLIYHYTDIVLTYPHFQHQS